MVAPSAGALALVVWLAAYALVFGAALLALALRVRPVTRERVESLRKAA